MLGNFEIKLNNELYHFLHNTRVKLCRNMDCEFNGARKPRTSDSGIFCTFKNIDLDETGRCEHYSLFLRRPGNNL